MKQVNASFPDFEKLLRDKIFAPETDLKSEKMVEILNLVGDQQVK